MRGTSDIIYIKHLTHISTYTTTAEGHYFTLNLILSESIIGVKIKLSFSKPL